MQEGGPVEDDMARQWQDYRSGVGAASMMEREAEAADPTLVPAGQNIFGQPTEAMTQSQMSEMLLDMMTGVGGTVKGVGKALKGIKRTPGTYRGPKIKDMTAEQYNLYQLGLENKIQKTLGKKTKIARKRAGLGPKVSGEVPKLKGKYKEEAEQLIEDVSPRHYGEKPIREDLVDRIRGEGSEYDVLSDVLGYQEGGPVEEEWSPTTIGGKLHKFLAERKMNKFMEQDPQLKAWYEQPSEIGTVLPATRVESNLFDVQSSINDKVLQDYSRSLSKHTTTEEGSPFEGVKFIDFMEGGAEKGRDMQYLETDTGRYRLAKSRQGGLLDPIRNFFGEIPKKVDMDKPYEFETDRMYGADSDRLSRKDKRDLEKIGVSEKPSMQESLGRLRGATDGYQEGGEVPKPLSGVRPEKFDYEPTDSGGFDVSGIYSIPAEQVGGEGGSRFYLGEGSGRSRGRGKNQARSRARFKMASTPADSIPAAMVESYFDDPDGYKEGGQVKGDKALGDWGGEQGDYMKALAASQDSTISEQELKSMALMDHFRKMGTGERVESSDVYNGKPAYKSEEAYRRAFGMQTPLNAKERFTQVRLGLNPEMFTAQRRGLLGKALLQRLGNEVQ
jgi:hypothetical protein